MKLIDLLNKIANGEEVPKKIIYDTYIWKYDKHSNDYEKFDESGDFYLFGEKLYVTLALNDEVEIIEEEKRIPEKLNKERYLGTDLSVEDDMFDKINEIIDYLKSKGDK